VPILMNNKSKENYPATKRIISLSHKNKNLCVKTINYCNSKCLI